VNILVRQNEANGGASVLASQNLCRLAFHPRDDAIRAGGTETVSRNRSTITAGNQKAPNYWLINR
jgi:hypothetical protein